MPSLTYKMNLPIELVLPDGFPCAECLVFANCSSPCSKLEKDHDKLTYLVADLRLCPDCGEKTIKNVIFMRSATTVKCISCAHLFTRIWDDEGITNWVRDYENKS